MRPGGAFRAGCFCVLAHGLDAGERNKGSCSAGADGQTARDIEAGRGVEALLEDLRAGPHVAHWLCILPRWNGALFDLSGSMTIPFPID